MTIPEKEIPVKNKVIIWITILLALSLLPACSSSATPSASPSSTPTPSPTPTASLSQYQLEYILLSKFPDVFWCDPDSYPVARDEQPNAIQQFPEIQANVPEFAAILEHLGMAVKSDYTDAEKLSIYQEHKKLSRTPPTVSSLIYGPGKMRVCILPVLSIPEDGSKSRPRRLASIPVPFALQKGL
jgi:hypothetical protein